MAANFSIITLALTRLEALLHLVDDVHLALTTDEAVGAMATAQRFQRIPDFHLNTDWQMMVGATGIEPVTPTMST
jgi:hypothetical protein